MKILLNDAFRRTPFMAAYRFARAAHWRSHTRKELDAHLRREPELRIHLGAGENVLASWLNFDLLPFRAPGLLYLDVTKPLPFESGTVASIFSEHMIEHFSRETAEAIIRECHRVVRPGGLLRISTPDLGILVKLYCEPHTPNQEQYIRTVVDLYSAGPSYLPGYVVNQLFKFGHQFLYDADTFEELLAAQGFDGIVRTRPGQSAHAVFHGIDFHANDYIAFESLVMEAQKADARSGA